MGVNLASLELMALARASGADFSRVVTLGRHRIDVTADVLERFFRQRGREDLASRIVVDLHDGFCEPLLLKAFGASEVRAVDVSDYEGAEIIHDMNTPMSENRTYSVLLDFGTLEHVFNIAVAFDNVALLCAPGAHILHVVPCNNFVGHGFYQFSPELFFEVYSEARGFSSTRVFVAPGGTPDIWYEVKAPRELGARVDIASRDQLHLLVLTRKAGSQTPLAQRAVQQSDYVATWSKGARAPPRRMRRRNDLERAVREWLTGLRHSRKMARKGVAAQRSDLTRHNVRDLTATF